MVGCSLTVAAEDGHGNEAKSAAPTAKYTFLSVAAPTADEVYKDLDADGLASRQRGLQGMSLGLTPVKR